MKNSLKVFGLAFLVSFALVFTSCEKENIDKVIEEVGETPTNNIPSTTTGSSIDLPKASSNSASISFQGSTTVINAYASYCNKNNKEYLMVSNDQALLSSSTVFMINVSDLDDGDFILAYRIDTLGGTPEDVAFWSKVDTTQTPSLIELLAGASVGTPNGSFNFSVDPVANTVKGNTSGMFVAGLIGGVPTISPYTINFDADIIQPHIFCD